MVIKIPKKRIGNNYLFSIELILLVLIGIGITTITDTKTGTNKNACLSLTFDDGLESHYSIVYPLLKEKNFTATFFIIANISSDPDDLGRRFMSSEDIKKLSEDNFEIGSHTLSHEKLTNLSKEEIEKELKESKELLEKTYNISIYSVAFPYGDYDKNVLKIARKYYLNTRSISEYEKEHLIINSFAMKQNINVQDICQYIDYANRNKLLLIIIFHDISNKPKLWDTSIEDFKTILKCIDDSKIKVGSITECNEIKKSLYVSAD